MLETGTCACAAVEIFGSGSHWRKGFSFKVEQFGYPRHTTLAQVPGCLRSGRFIQHRLRQTDSMSLQFDQGRPYQSGGKFCPSPRWFNLGRPDRRHFARQCLREQRTRDAAASSVELPTNPKDRSRRVAASLSTSTISRSRNETGTRRYKTSSAAPLNSGAQTSTCRPVPTRRFPGSGRLRQPLNTLKTSCMQGSR